MKPNKGRLPRECVTVDADGNRAYRSVHVVLFNGHSTKKADHRPWPSGGGRPPTNWAISDPPGPFEIEFYELA